MRRNDDGVAEGDSIHHYDTGDKCDQWIEQSRCNYYNDVLNQMKIALSLCAERLRCDPERWCWRSGLWVTIAINYAWVSEWVYVCVCVGFLPVLSVHVLRGLLCQIVRPAAGCLIDSGVNVIVPVCLSCCRSCNCLASDWASPPLSPSHATFTHRNANPGKTRYCILIRFMFGWWR